MNFPAQITKLMDEPLAKYTSYKIGGPAKILAFPRTKQDIYDIGSYLEKSGDGFFILGNGSNILASDDGFNGVVICTRELEPMIRWGQDGLVSASASVLNARLLRACAERGLGGIEFLSGVPGNLGGAVMMNAGTGSGWIQDVIESVEVLDFKGGERKFAKGELSYSYREQHFLQDSQIIWSVTIRLLHQGAEVVQAKLAESIKKRKAAQPIEWPSCGSVFRNPEGKNAWALIDQAGLRGMKIGGACFSAKHCNFILNEGGATQKDVSALIELAKEKVFQQTGIKLQEEVVYLKPKYLR